MHAEHNTSTYNSLVKLKLRSSDSSISSVVYPYTFNTVSEFGEFFSKWVYKSLNVILDRKVQKYS